MRRLVLAFISAAALLWLAEPAWADQSALKLSNLNFGNQPTGSATVGFETITNRTSRAIRIISIATSGPRAAPFGDEPGDPIGSCPVFGIPPVIPGGKSCTVAIVFRPPTAGVWFADFQVETDLDGLFTGEIRGHAN